MVSEQPGDELMLSWSQDDGLSPSLPQPGLRATAGGAMIPFCSQPQEVMGGLVSLQPLCFCCWLPCWTPAQVPTERPPNPRGAQVLDATIVAPPCRLSGKGHRLGLLCDLLPFASKDPSPLTPPPTAASSPGSQELGCLGGGWSRPQTEAVVEVTGAGQIPVCPQPC